MYIIQRVVGISRKFFYENLGTLHLAAKLFYHLPGFHPKRGYLNPYPLYYIPKIKKYLTPNITFV